MKCHAEIFSLCYSINRLHSTVLYLDLVPYFICTCLPGEDAQEEEGEENPIAIEFHEEQDAFYLKDPKKALQGFFDREGIPFDHWVPHPCA